MGEFFIRKAVESDADEISKLIHLVGINPMGLDWRRFLIASDQAGILLGCGQIKPHGKNLRELASIAVSLENRDKGIATAIIDKLIQGAERPLYLMCMSDMETYYERFGFRALRREEMPRYFQRMHSLFHAADVFMRSDKELRVMKLV